MSLRFHFLSHGCELGDGMASCLCNGGISGWDVRMIGRGDIGFFRDNCIAKELAIVVACEKSFCLLNRAFMLFNFELEIFLFFISSLIVPMQSIR